MSAEGDFLPPSSFTIPKFCWLFIYHPGLSMNQNLGSVALVPEPVAFSEEILPPQPDFDLDTGHDPTAHGCIASQQGPLNLRNKACRPSLENSQRVGAHVSEARKCIRSTLGILPLGRLLLRRSACFAGASRSMHGSWMPRSRRWCCEHGLVPVASNLTAASTGPSAIRCGWVRP